MMDGTAVKEVERITREATEIQTVELDDRIYSRESVKEIRPAKDPAPSPFELHTLASLVQYLEENRDGLALNQLTVHVVSPSRVELVGETRTEDQQARWTYATVSSGVTPPRFGVPKDVETFIVELQARYVDAHDRGTLLKLVGNLKQVNEADVKDDGVTQEVAVRSGVSTVSEVDVPNPVTLVPFRTFPEVEQPASLFVFRLKKGPTAELHEADGGKWELDAVKAVGEWLKEHIPEGPAVLF